MTLRTACVAWLLASCGGAAQTADPPAAANESPATAVRPAKPKTESEPAKPPESAAAEPASNPPAKTESAPEPAAASGPSKRPSEILGAPMVAFIVDYQGSTPHETAEKNCEAEAQGDASLRSDCMQKARAEFRADVLHFKKDAQGHWWLTVYERKGSNLPEVYKAQVDFADEKKDSISVRLKDGGKQGSRPFFAGAKQILVSMPDDYSIRLDDPKLGRLVYNAKVGLVGK